MQAEKSLQTFLNELASSAPAPGGGAAAALCGALSGALTSMVCNLTIGKKKFIAVDPEMRTVLEHSERLRRRFTQLIEEDEAAFNVLMDAFKLPKDTDAEKEIRTAKVQEATKKAALVPLEMMNLCCELLPLALAGAVKGNPNVVSDAGVSAIAAGAAAQAAALNVHINLLGIKDRAWAEDKFSEMNQMLKEVKEMSDSVMRAVTQKLSV